MNISFPSELYIDTDKKSFKDLKFKKLGFLNMVPALIAKVARDAVRKVTNAILVVVSGVCYYCCKEVTCWLASRVKEEEVFLLADRSLAHK